MSDAEVSTPSAYPLRMEARLDTPLSRWLWVLKPILLIPHVVVLAFLWLALVILTAIVFFAVLFTGRYPRTLFDFNVGVMRWTWRVSYYGFGAFGTDRYPPFTLHDVPDYPTDLWVEYPETLSRPLVLVKWLLAIPHYLIVSVFVGGAAWATARSADVRLGGWSLVVGAFIVFTAFGITTLGIAAIAIDKTMRDDTGFLAGPDRHFATTTYALPPPDLRRASGRRAGAVADGEQHLGRLGQRVGNTVPGPHRRRLDPDRGGPPVDREHAHLRRSATGPPRRDHAMTRPGPSWVSGREPSTGRAPVA